jgi:sugar/nucleoside kinase (ribokinase family)
MQSRAPAVVTIGAAFSRPSGTPAFGGIAAEVALGLAAAGCPSTPISRIGDDDAGRAMLAAFEAAGLPTDAMQIDRDLPTGRLRAPLFGTGGEARLDALAAFDMLQWDGELGGLAAGCSWVLFDGTSRRHAQSRGTVDRFLYEARGATRVFDLSRRPPGAIDRTAMLGGLEQAEVAILDAAAIDAIAVESEPSRRPEAILARSNLGLLVELGPAGPCRVWRAGGDRIEEAPGDGAADADARTVRLLAALLAGRPPAELLAASAT